MTITGADASLGSMVQPDRRGVKTQLVSVMFINNSGTLGILLGPELLGQYRGGKEDEKETPCFGTGWRRS